MLIRQRQRLKIGQPSKRIGWNRQRKDVQGGDAPVEQVRDCDRFVERVTRELREINRAEDAFELNHESVSAAIAAGFGFGISVIVASISSSTPAAQMRSVMSVVIRRRDFRHGEQDRGRKKRLDRSTASCRARSFTRALRLFLTADPVRPRLRRQLMTPCSGTAVASQAMEHVGMSELLNRMIAGRLDDVAEMLRRHGADPVYVRAYALAASAVRHWPISMALMYKHRGIRGLEELPGVGAGIARVIRRLLTHHRLPPLAALLATDTESSSRGPVPPPPMDELLDVDREYRQKAAAGELPLIAPERFNPGGDRWLPVLHSRRGPRRYTALFSNTERAHRLGRTRDWVVLYAKDAGGERQYTVITSTHGALRGHRVVAGHERECRAAERRAA